MGKYASMLREPVASPTPGIVAALAALQPLALWDAGLSISYPAPNVTNLLIRSQEMDNAGAWTTEGTSIIANSAAAPDGEVTADTLRESGTSGEHRHIHAAFGTLTASAIYSVSVYVKREVGTRHLILQHFRAGTANGAYAVFDLTNGVVGSSGVYGDGISATPYMRYVGDGWYRCILTGQPSASGGAHDVRVGLAATPTSTNTNRTGDGTSGLYLWGAQAEAGSVTPYIRTTSATVTRGGASQWINIAPDLPGVSVASDYDLALTGLTFAGTAGRRSAAECLTSAGSGYGAISANTAVTNSWHKDSASFSIFALLSPVDSGAAQNIAGTAYTSGQYGIQFSLDAAERPTLYVLNNSTSLTKTADIPLAVGSYNFVGLSLNEAGTGFFYANGMYLPVSGSNTWSAAYTSPTATAATGPLEFGRATSGSNALASGTRLPFAGAVARAVTKTEFDVLFDAIRGRWSI